MWKRLIVMDSRTYENWKKIKATFEESGNTDNQFYKRAVQILKTGIDPFDRKLKPWAVPGDNPTIRPPPGAELYMKT